MLTSDFTVMEVPPVHKREKEGGNVQPLAHKTRDTPHPHHVFLHIVSIHINLIINKSNKSFQIIFSFGN